MICIKYLKNLTMYKCYNIIKHNNDWYICINDIGHEVIISSTFFITIDEYRNNQIDNILI